VSTVVIPAAPVQLRWQPLLPLALVIVGLLALFRGTAEAMVAIWSRSDTFAHAFLVPPLVLWLIWRDRGSVVASPLKASPAWLLPMAIACLLWLLGEAAGANSATQFALVAMIVLAVPALLGWPLSRALAFPLLFLFFSVPAGEFLVGPMMEATADFTVAALRLSGIPVYREGLQFVIPSGNWSVVEACSGVRYLIASLMVGTLFAHLNYRSRWRKLAFIGVSIAVPVVANWLRAYLIVLLGHLSGNRIAAGADHLIYGWIFFGVVIALMFLVGARFSEHTGGETREPSPASAAVPWRAGPTWCAAVAVAVLAGLTATAGARLLATDGPQVDGIVLPEALPGGWTRSDRPLTTWTPAYANPGAVAEATYRAGNRAVGVWVAHYRHQSAERKLIGSTNQLVSSGSSTWLSAPARPVPVATELGSLTLRSATLRTPADPKATPLQRLLVLQVYRLPAAIASDPTAAQVHLAIDRLLGRGDAAAALLFYTETAEGVDEGSDLADFVARHLGLFVASVDAAAARP
jgi:exosortase A